MPSDEKRGMHDQLRGDAASLFGKQKVNSKIDMTSRTTGGSSTQENNHLL